MQAEESIRIDKYLWTVRLFKTRTVAADEVKNHRVIIDGMPVKTSRMLKVGDEFYIKKNPVLYHFRVKQITKNRLGAKLVPDFLEDLTPEAELVKLKVDMMSSAGIRDRGTGRPTKKDRRDLDDFTNK